MQDEYARLRKQIEEGLDALDELQRHLEAAEKQAGEERPKFRLIKGGLIGAGIWAGVEWLRNSPRAAAALAFSGLAVGGLVIADPPHSPGSDPPASINPPASVAPTPTKRPTLKPTPPRTSPLRTQARITPPSAAPPSTAPPTKEPVRVATQTPSMKATITLPSVTVPTVSLPVTPTITVALPTESVTPEVCIINILGIKVCPPRGRS